MHEAGQRYGTGALPNAAADGNEGYPNMLKIVLVVAMAAGLIMTGVPSEGQPKKLPRVGILMYGSPPPAPGPEQAIIQALRELGWVDGQSMSLLIRYAEGRPERLSGLARGLVESNVDLVVTVGTDVVKITMGVLGTTPIVASVSEDPVQVGLIASFARPGGTLTGVAFTSSEVAAKRLELLKEILPRLSRVAVLWDPTHVDLEFKELEAAARTLSVSLQSIEARAPEELDAALRVIGDARADALMLVPTRMMNLNAKRIAAFALERRLPAVSMWSSFAQAGGLMTYGPDVGAMIRRSASHVDRILKGAKPADLPVERPTHYQLVVNLRTARALGVAIPPSVLLRADRVIE
jgi:putative ABC transport system substrate-binding protein